MLSSWGVAGSVGVSYGVLLVFLCLRLRLLCLRGVFLFPEVGLHNTQDIMHTPGKSYNLSLLATGRAQTPIETSIVGLPKATLFVVCVSHFFDKMRSEIISRVCVDLHIVPGM